MWASVCFMSTKMFIMNDHQMAGKCEGKKEHFGSLSEAHRERKKRNTNPNRTRNVFFENAKKKSLKTKRCSVFNEFNRDILQFLMNALYHRRRTFLWPNQIHFFCRFFPLYTVWKFQKKKPFLMVLFNGLFFLDSVHELFHHISLNENK